MKVFVTGATGFIGSATVRELIAAGHQVLGLARSDAAANALTAAGAHVQRGALDDLDSLRNAAAASDGVIHTAFIHDYANFAASSEADRRAIETFGEALAGSGRPLVVAAGIAGVAPGRMLTEEDLRGKFGPTSTRVSEEATLALAQRGVRASVMRLPPTVHGEGDHGFIPGLVNMARAKGEAAYPSDGTNRWAAVHRIDAARLFRLALESAPAGTLLHAIGDEGVAVRDIAAVFGRRLHVPVVSLPANEVGAYYGFLGTFFAMDIAASSTLTQQRFGWQPTQPGLLADLDHEYYFTHEG
jgi:nucleoside-diphosphate-sugar epimerase